MQRVYAIIPAHEMPQATIDRAWEKERDVECAAQYDERKEECVTEVNEFLSANELVSRTLRNFAIQYDRLSDVWINCERPDWMLELLKRNCNWRRDYRSNEGLMNYVRSLREMSALHHGEPNPAVEHYFNFGSGVECIRKEIESRDIGVL